MKNVALSKNKLAVKILFMYSFAHCCAQALGRPIEISKKKKIDGYIVFKCEIFECDILFIELSRFRIY